MYFEMAAMLFLFIHLAFLLISSASLTVKVLDEPQEHANTETTDLCIIGGGPAGLHLAFLLSRSSNTTFQLFEQAATPGSFFHKYPISRTLESVNKIAGDKWTNRRWDGHSLDDDMLFSSYSSNYHPSAAEYVQYLEDFSRKIPKDRLHYNTKVLKVEEVILYKKYFKARGFNHLYEMSVLKERRETRVSCHFVVFATGVVPTTPRFHPDTDMMERLIQEKYVERYSDVDVQNRDSYKGKNILIVGKGKSAMETIEHLKPLVNKIIMLNRDTHKSSLFQQFEHDDITTDYFWPCTNPETRVHENLHLRIGTVKGGGEMQLQVTCAHLGDGLVYEVPDDLSEWDMKSTFTKDDIAADFSVFHERFDKVIFCTGFNASRSIYDLLSPTLQEKVGVRAENKFPTVKSPSSALIEGSSGLYVIGSAAGQQSIGEIRSKTEALYQLLEVQLHNKTWPSTKFTMPAISNADAIVKRMMESTTTFRAPSDVCDVVVFRPGTCIIHGTQSAEHFFPVLEKPPFSRYFADVPLFFSPELARRAGALQFLTLCFSKSGNHRYDGEQRVRMTKQEVLKVFGFHENGTVINGRSGIKNAAKFQKRGLLQLGATGSARHYDGTHYVMSYFDMTQSEGMTGWVVTEDEHGKERIVLKPLSTHHMFLKNRFSVLRPVQWWIRDVVSSIEPHGDCQDWDDAQRRLKTFLREDGQGIKNGGRVVL